MGRSQGFYSTDVSQEMGIDPIEGTERAENRKPWGLVLPGRGEEAKNTSANGRQVAGRVRVERNVAERIRVGKAARLEKIVFIGRKAREHGTKRTMPVWLGSGCGAPRRFGPRLDGGTVHWQERQPRRAWNMDGRLGVMVVLASR